MIKKLKLMSVVILKDLRGLFFGVQQKLKVLRKIDFIFLRFEITTTNQVCYG